MSPSPAVDRAALDALTARLGERGPAFRDGLLRSWLGESPGRREELERLSGTTDAEGLAQFAHRLRSGAGSLGAHRLAEVCHEVDEAVRAGRPVDLPRAAGRIRKELDRADEGFAAMIDED